MTTEVVALVIVLASERGFVIEFADAGEFADLSDSGSWRRLAQMSSLGSPTSTALMES